MPFTNAIAGGNGSLVRNDIQSPNYVTGVSGWRINKDGTCEFNSGTFRSSVQVGPSPGAHIIMDAATDTLLVYDAGNNLIASLSPTTQTIGGVLVKAGISTYDPTHSTIDVRITGDQIQIIDANTAPLAAASYLISNNQSVSGQIAQLLISSGSIGAVGSREAQIELVSESGNLALSSWIQLTQQKAGPGAQTSGQAVQTSGVSASEPFIVHTGDFSGTTDVNGKVVVTHGANFTPANITATAHGAGSPSFGNVAVVDGSITSTQFQVICWNFNGTLRTSAAVMFYYLVWGKA